MIQIKNIESLQEGKQYAMTNKKINGDAITVNCISLDYSGLNRKIAYFCFTDRVKKIPSKDEFIKAMKKRGVSHTFALWDFDFDGVELTYNL